MTDRIYDIVLECGCMYSADGGGGLIPCHYGYGCGKKDCNEHNQCPECLNQIKLCEKTHKDWYKSTDYKEYQDECVIRNM